MKVRDIINLVEGDGWYIVSIKGSHRHYKHPAKRGRVTIAGHPNIDLSKGTLASIYRQAGLKKGKI